MSLILAIDQGTSSSRAIIYDQNLRALAKDQREIRQIFSHPAWVEHDPTDIWESVLSTAQSALVKAGKDAKDIAAIGLTNQRETTVIWDRATGQPIYNAIVWQDRRTADLCDALRLKGHEAMVSQKTGLLLDPYFSASKIKWILDNVPNARSRAKAGELAFGTIDSWLIWNLTGGKTHVCDATNAARTLLYDIERHLWDPELCALFDVPMQILPQLHDCADDFGHTDPALFGASIPITGVAGDQQAAAIAQACFDPGMIKSTYGTGCFALLNTGKTRLHSRHRLLSTLAYRLDGQSTYALEGSIFIAGAVVQWLRDGLKLIDQAAQTEALAHASDPEQQLIMVPAFTGLGAPYWRPEARGAIFGLTRNSGAPDFARAALESVAFQTRDLIEAMHADWPSPTQHRLRIDGGMAENQWAMQFLADILGAEVEQPSGTETTALGAAYLAGLGRELCPAPAEFAKTWRAARRFSPQMAADMREARYGAWKRAVKATILATQNG